MGRDFRAVIVSLFSLRLSGERVRSRGLLVGGSVEEAKGGRSFPLVMCHC